MINFPFIQLWLLNTRSQTVLLTSLIVLRKFIAVVHFTSETFFLSICFFSYSTSLHFKPFFLFPPDFYQCLHVLLCCPFSHAILLLCPCLSYIFPPLFPFTLWGGVCITIQKTKLPEPSSGPQALGLWAFRPRKLQDLCTPLLWDVSPELLEMDSQFPSG